jgi:hypothetical protein
VGRKSGAITEEEILAVRSGEFGGFPEAERVLLRLPTG